VGQVAADNGFRVMAYDVPSRMSWNPGEIPFFLVLRGDTADEISPPLNSSASRSGYRYSARHIATVSQCLANVRHQHARLQLHALA
jgi:hypothetical protein